MGNIKSTLELVLERTRNMVLSEKEKQEQAIESFRQNINGLLQKYEDHLLTADGFRKELAALQQSSGIDDPRHLIEEMSRRIDPDGDNEVRLALMETVCGTDVGKVASVLEDYRKKTGVLDIQSRERATAQLAARWGISGSAVVPHLQADRAWAEEHQHLHSKALRRIAEAAAR